MLGIIPLLAPLLYDYIKIGSFIVGNNIDVVFGVWIN